VVRDDRATRVAEYGVQTSHSKTILTVTEDLAEAERTLDMLGQGRLVQRTVTYSPWIAAEAQAVTDAFLNEPVQDSGDSDIPGPCDQTSAPT
jgi:uncharacterized phage-associated protein